LWRATALATPARHSNGDARGAAAEEAAWIEGAMAAWTDGGAA